MTFTTGPSILSTLAAAGALLAATAAGAQTVTHESIPGIGPFARPAALGLNDRLKPFALNYLAAHKK